MTKHFCDKCGAECHDRNALHRVFARVIQNSDIGSGRVFDSEVCGACLVGVLERLRAAMDWVKES